MVLLDNVYASLRKGSAPRWWPGQRPLSPVSLFLSLEKNIHIILRMKNFRIVIQKIYFYLKIYLRLEWTHFHYWLRCILHLFPFSCELVQNNFAFPQHFGQVRKSRGKRRFTSYLKYRGGCFMFKKQDPPFVLWKFSREFQSSADKIF